MSPRIVFFIAALAIAGCGSREEKPPAPATPAATPAPFDPLKDGILLELAEDHSIKFGPTEESDVVITMQGDRVRVVFREGFLKSVPKDAMIDLGVGGTEVDLTPAQYRALMSRLHDYLHEVTDVQHHGSGS